MIKIALAEIPAAWRALSGTSDADRGLVFQSRAGVGCAAVARFLDSMVFTARHQGQPVALGLFNRQKQRFHC